MLISDLLPTCDSAHSYIRLYSAGQLYLQNRYPTQSRYPDSGFCLYCQAVIYIGIFYHCFPCNDLVYHNIAPIKAEYVPNHKPLINLLLAMFLHTGTLIRAALIRLKHHISETKPLIQI